MRKTNQQAERAVLEQERESARGRYRAHQGMAAGRGDVDADEGDPDLTEREKNLALLDRNGAQAGKSSVPHCGPSTRACTASASAAASRSIRPASRCVPMPPCAWIASARWSVWPSGRATRLVCRQPMSAGGRRSDVAERLRFRSSADSAQADSPARQAHRAEEVSRVDAGDRHPAGLRGHPGSG